jgi:hypothetical protein
VVTPLASFSQFFPLSAWEFYPKWMIYHVSIFCLW